MTPHNRSDQLRSRWKISPSYPAPPACRQTTPKIAIAVVCLLALAGCSGGSGTGMASNGSDADRSGAQTDKVGNGKIYISPNTGRRWPPPQNTNG